MKCQAISRNLNPCSRHVADGEAYCPQHESYTPELHKQRWFNRYILGVQQYSRSFYLLYPFSESHHQAIVKPLRSGEIVMTKEDIQAIPAERCYLDVYLLLVSLGVANPQDNPSLFNEAMRTYFTLFAWVPNPSPAYSLQQEIEKHLIGSSGFLLFEYLQSIPKVRFRDASYGNEFFFHTIPSLLETQGAKELAWFPHEALDRLRLLYERDLGVDHPLTKTLVQRWLPDLKELYETEKAIQKIKMDQCKEELMMNRWHPDRVSAYLEMGLDIDDM